MDEMQDYEVNDILDALPYLDRNSWEQSRLQSLVTAQVNSKKQLKATDIIKLPWDEDNVTETSPTEISTEDIERLKSNNLEKNAKKLIELIKENPFQNPPPYEKLAGDLKGLYSRRINIQHRLVYQVYDEEKVIKIIRMWTHYE